MPNLFAESPEFRRLIEGSDRIDLPRVALEIARDADPSVEPDHYLDRIADLAARVSDRTSPGARPRAILGQLNWVFHVEEGFRGNTAEYYDPRNSYLNEVLDRRVGIPISLAILYAAVAAPLGLDLAGVNLPAHFLLRVVGSDPALFVDPFHAGRFLDREGCAQVVSAAMGHPVPLGDSLFEPTDARTTVARMLRNLKTIHLQAGDFAAALPVARRLAAVERTNFDEVRDYGLIALRAGRPGEAMTPLARYGEARSEAPDASAIAAFLRQARHEIALSN